MNGKLAKKLRKVAQQLALGQDTVYSAKEHVVKARLQDGTVGYVKKLQIVLDPDCARAVYQQLKRNYYRIQRGEVTQREINQTHGR